MKLSDVIVVFLLAGMAFAAVEMVQDEQPSFKETWQKMRHRIANTELTIEPPSAFADLLLEEHRMVMAAILPIGDAIVEIRDSLTGTQGDINTLNTLLHNMDATCKDISHQLELLVAEMQE